ncbi:UNVERIFIED_ORG: hypothetical protein FNL38_1011251 [Nocardia globerula]|uniref:Uncharacterized protein n=1 Tax=Nocardia globerula TaxID=1818 RepID=A0A652YYW6_NOCGL|nr:hypothetical protein C8E04_2470 [Rhodococcus globerulus]
MRVGFASSFLVMRSSHTVFSSGRAGFSLDALGLGGWWTGGVVVSGRSQLVG